jgi:3-dehydroquinate synthase
MIQTVPVALSGRAYEVLIGPGLIDQAGARIAPLLKRPRLAVVSDETVWGLHGARFAAALEAAGITALPVVIPPGEQTKSFAGLADLSDRLLSLSLDRGDLIAALGGGVVGDLAGFAAAIYKRGIDFVQIPTTLLAQVDSSVGGKTAIDTPQGKNLIGAFHQPRLVLADLEVLSTLPHREMRAGYAEVVKYGLLGDFAFFDWLETNAAAVLAREPQALGRAVARSVAMKAEIVAEDETEQGRRALLNLGHTFAHALEAEAIAAAGLPTTLAEIPGHPFAAGRLLAHMGQDKKAEAGQLTFVLARGIGEAFVAKAVDPAAVHQFLLTEGAAA